MLHRTRQIIGIYSACKRSDFGLSHFGLRKQQRNEEGKEYRQSQQEEELRLGEEENTRAWRLVQTCDIKALVNAFVPPVALIRL